MASPLGTTPLTLTTLPPGTAVRSSFKKTGYHDAVTGKLDVPGPGKEIAVHRSRSRSPTTSRAFSSTSEPPGAQVVQNGQLLAGGDHAGRGARRGRQAAAVRADARRITCRP